MKERIQYSIDLMNQMGASNTPFLFIIDFECDHPIIQPLNTIDSAGIKYNINGHTNVDNGKQSNRNIQFNRTLPCIDQYRKAFELVKKNLRFGNSYLTNLTQQTPIETNLSLEEIYHFSKAKYKLWLKDQFVVFSPESFIQIKDNKIFSYPMKGTIDASIPDAENKLMNDKKEQAEHITIVDLIRNDLNLVAKHVRVNKYRFIEKVETIHSTLLQSSSEICGELDDDFASNLGDILFTLLPAGSISGAPKEKTMAIIKEAEGFDRKYFTGICGIFDGKELDSGVMIRFIEQTDKGLIFKSGGGITVNSKLNDEYQEMVNKVYVPII